MARNQRKFSLIIAAKDRASRVFGKVRAGFSKLGSVLTKAAAGISTAFLAATAAIGGLIAKAVGYGDNLAKTADKIGATTEQLSSMRHAAKLAGIESNTLDMALQRMTRRLSEAAAGGGEAKGAIEELGLDAQKLATMGPEAALNEIVKALEGVENQTDRVRLAFKFFDSEGVSLVNLTSEGLREATKEARALGLAINRDTAAGLERVGDAWTRIKSALTGAAVQFTAALLGPIEKLSTKVTEFAKSGQLKEWAREAARILIELVAILIKSIPQALVAILEIAHKITQVFRGWGLIFNGLKQLLTAWSILVLEVFSKVNNGIQKILEATNIGGANDSAIAKTRQLGQALAQDLGGAERNLQMLVAEQARMITASDRQAGAIDGMKQKVDAASASFTRFAEDIRKNTEAAIAEAEAADKLAASYDNAAASKQKYVSINSGSTDLSSVDGFSFGDIRDSERTE